MATVTVNMTEDEAKRYFNEQNRQSTTNKEPSTAEPKSNILEVLKGFEHELIIDQDITDKTRFMYPAFSQAKEATKEIVDNTDRWWFVYGKSWRKMSDIGRYNALYGYSNNVIAFFGARGQGKTSVMLSFSNALNQNGSGQERDAKLFPVEIGKAKDFRRFYVLPPIDPTMLGSNDSILTIILSHLTKEIEYQWKNRADTIRERDRENGTYTEQEEKHWEILRDILNCQNGILSKQAKKEKEQYDLEHLLKNANVMEIKINLQKIFSYFFKLHQMDEEHSMFVVQLDDTDMKLDNAYEVLEDVRKYLSLPNVIVLMACYRKQLQHLIEVEYRDKLKNYVNVFETSAHMAAKYIDKLIPPAHMIFLPRLKELWDSKNNPVLIREKEKNIQRELNLENYIYEQIYRRTGLTFIGHLSFVHDIIPSTLRGLTALINLLENMPPLVEDEMRDRPRYANDMLDYCERRLRIARKRYQNLIQFENYFMNDWAVSRLDNDSDNDNDSKGNKKQATHYRKILKDIEHNSANTRILMAIQQLSRLSKPEDSEYHTAHRKLKSILTEAIKERELEKPTVLVYIRLLNAIHEWKKLCVSNEQYRFPYALHTYFSIQLNKQAILDEIVSLEEWKKNYEKKEEKDRKIFFAKFSHLVAMLTRGNSEEYEKDVNNDFLTSSKWYSDGSTKGKKGKEDILMRNFIETLGSPPVDIAWEDAFSGNPLNQSKAIHRLQEYFVFLCCNWNVQSQFYENIALDGKSVSDIFKALGACLEKRCGENSYLKNKIAYGNDIANVMKGKFSEEMEDIILGNKEEQGNETPHQNP